MIIIIKLLPFLSLTFPSAVEELLFHGWLKSNFPQGGYATYDPPNLYLVVSRMEMKPQGHNQTIFKNPAQNSNREEKKH